MAKNLLKTASIHLFVMIAIILIVLLPRVPETDTIERLHRNGSTYTQQILVMNEYSVEKHWHTIRSFFTEIIENKSLGKTRYNAPVGQELVTSMKNSMTIIFAALVLSFLLGIWKGFYDFKMQRKRRNILGHWTTWLFQSIPDFFIILFVQLLLIRYFPITQFFGREGWDAFILPAILVAIFPTMYIARITSAALAAQVGQLYIQVARAKGLTEAIILYKHIFRNCIGSILTHLTPLMVYILSNLLMVEYFMYYPGATLRLFIAMDYDASYGTGLDYEPALVLGILFGFMLLIFVVQVISHIARRRFEPRMGGDVG